VTAPNPPETAHHILVVTGVAPEDREYAIECPGLTPTCMSWTECTDPTCATRDDPDGDEGVLHGVDHRWFSFGWCVPDGECFVASNDYLATAAEYIDRGKLPPGRYPVTFSVEDETDLVLDLAEGSA
jgi:hypothetical protein